LANVLYQQVNLRPIVCHALINLVEKNKQLLQQNLDDTEMMRRYRLTIGEVQQNVNLLATFSVNFLSTLFNVFSQTMPPYRSPIADCIKTFLSISSAQVFYCISRFNIQDLRTTFEKVSSLLQMNLNNPTKGEKSELPTLAQTAIDLTNIMISYLPADTFDAIWNLFVPLLRLKEDPNMQRRAYRCLAKLAEVDAGKEFLVNRLDHVTEIFKRSDTHTTSQKVRQTSLAKTKVRIGYSHFIK
jgi:ribosomal RNA-processing protein 12